MWTSAPSDKVSFYQENGFVVLPDVLDKEELTIWRESISRALANRTSRMPKAGENYGASFRPGGFVEGEYYNKVFTQKINLWMTDDGVRELVLDTRLGHIAADLAGVDAVRLYLDQALIKEPWGNPTAFHIDVPFWAFTSPKALTIWIALTDSTLENGALCYIPGSHKIERYDNSQIAPHLGALFDIYPEIQGIDPMFCPIPAGSAVVHNGLTAHGAGANMTRHRRMAMTIAFMPDGSTYNGKQDILPNELVSTLSVGDPLNERAQNPLVFSHVGGDAAL